jgi:hypothetical protein
VEPNDLSRFFASEMNSRKSKRNNSNRFSGASTHCLDTKTPPTIGEKPTTAAGCTNPAHAAQMWVRIYCIYCSRHLYIYNKGPSNKEPRALKSPHSINSRSTIHCATWAYICISNVPHWFIAELRTLCYTRSRRTACFSFSHLSPSPQRQNFSALPRRNARVDRRTRQPFMRN